MQILRGEGSSFDCRAESSFLGALGWWNTLSILEQRAPGGQDNWRPFGQKSCPPLSMLMTCEIRWLTFKKKYKMPWHWQGGQMCQQGLMQAESRLEGSCWPGILAKDGRGTLKGVSLKLDHQRQINLLLRNVKSSSRVSQAYQHTWNNIRLRGLWDREEEEFFGIIFHYFPLIWLKSLLF